MNDDLNTSIALSVIFELLRLANKLLEDNNTTCETLNVVDELFSRLGGDVLGIVPDEYPQATAADETLVDNLIGMMIEQRNDARRQKDFAAADNIRNKLNEMGVMLEDNPEGTEWRRK